MSSTVSIIALLVLVAQLASCSAWAAPTWNLVESSEDGVPFLMNPAVPRDGTRAIGADQQWRLGADEATDPILGLAQDAVTDSQGTTYLLDAVMSTIFVISPQGEVQRQIGGQGDGPGEFRNGSQLVFMPDGSLGVLEMMPGQVVCLDVEGNPRSGFHPGGGAAGTGMSHFQQLAVDGDQVILGGVQTNFDNEGVTVKYSLVRYQADGSVAQVVRERKDVQSGNSVSISLGGDEDDFTRNWVLAANGDVVVFPRAFEYRLEYYNRQGQLERIVERPYETLRRSDEDLAAARKQAEALQARFTGMTRTVEERERDISAVYPRPDGSLWVACSQGARDCPAGSLGVFDVFDPAGRYLQTLRIDGVDYDPARDNFTLTGDRLYVFKEARKAPSRTSTAGGGGMMMMMIQGGSDEEEDDDGELRPFEVICYRIGS